MTDPITASRERIVEEIQSDLAENGYACKRCVKDLMELVNPALLQHETVVREEMARICDTQAKDGVSPYATGDEMDSYDYAKQCGFEQGATKCAHLIRTTQPTI